MTKLNDEQQAAFNELARPYLENDQVQRMKGYVQHGSISTYAHCLRVAQTSFALAQRLHVHVNQKDLVAGALLHDFYLYDWHDRTTSRPNHATRHPLYAAENAVEKLDVNPHVRSMIQTHMWPLPPTRVPSSREAWLLCAADKWCALTETLTMRKTDSNGRGKDGNRSEGKSKIAPARKMRPKEYILVPEGSRPEVDTEPPAQQPKPAKAEATDSAPVTTGLGPNADIAPIGDSATCTSATSALSPDIPLSPTKGDAPC